MDRSTKVTIIVSFGLFTLLLIAVPFFKYMTPSARALANRPYFDLSNIQKAQYIEFQPGKFVLKLCEGEINVYSVPFQDNKYLLPDLKWDRAYIPCDSFKPDSDGTNLKVEGKFRCIDSSLNEFWSTEYVWDFSGRNLGKHTEDLQVPAYEIEGTSLYLGKL